ncbi:hypothetical protein ACHAPJ_011121, partial [Fusarium lateritium]
QGTSGSWVVDQESRKLCGSVMAVFDQEPYALMITSDDLFSDIKEFSPNIVSIQLPTPKPNPPDEGTEIEPTDKGKAKVQESRTSRPADALNVLSQRESLRGRFKRMLPPRRPRESASE